MKIYAVGGAVRDRLLGLPVQDHDYVVVGATAEQMLVAGFKPVGRDFPVFLHPHTHEEYALARTERKSSPGYTGFVVHAAPDVSLEDDLARRDLTINAMAEADDGQLIDPYGGHRDLADGILRHVSPAFVEDPVRILRLARFAARFGFTVAPETAELCRQMVAAGEVDHLVAERVWQEMARGLMEARPSILFKILRDCGALARLLPEIDRLFGVPQPAQWHPEIDTGDHTLRVLDYAAAQGWPLETRFAALCHDLGKALTAPALLPSHPEHEARGVAVLDALCERLRVPRDCRDLAMITCREHGVVHRATDLSAEAVWSLLSRCDALRKPARFLQMLDACVADARGRPGYETVDYPQATRLAKLQIAAASIDAGRLATQLVDKSKIAETVVAARIAAIDVAMSEPQI